MAWAKSSKRQVCMGCSSPLLSVDLGRQYCQLCRGALLKGHQSWHKRMVYVAKTNRAKGKVRSVDDPFAGFSDEEMWREG